MRSGDRQIAVFAVCLVFSIVLVFSIANTKTVKIVDGGSYHTLRTMSDDYRALALGAGVELGQYDELSLTSGGKITVVEVLRAFPVSTTADGVTTEVYVTGGTVEQLLMNCGIELREDDIVSKPLDSSVAAGDEIRVLRVEVELVTEEAVLSYRTTKQPDKTMEYGKTVVNTKGRDGLAINTLKKVYVDGVLDSTEVVESEVVEEPVNEVLTYGTLETGEKSAAAVSRGDFRYTKVYDMVATAYTYGNGTAGDITASGKPAKVGYVAVDPKVIPLGTRLYIAWPDGSYCYGYATAQDTGGAIKGNKIDLFFETTAECINFGRRNVKVYVLE